MNTLINRDVLPIATKDEYGVIKLSQVVTSITPGTGLTGTSSDTAITSSGTINLKIASDGEIGGIKTGYKETGAHLGVKVSNGQAYVTVNKSAISTSLGYDPAGVVQYVIDPSNENDYWTPVLYSGSTSSEELGFTPDDLVTGETNISNNLQFQPSTGTLYSTIFKSGPGISDFSAGTIKLDTIAIPSYTGSTSYTTGTSGQVLKTNGSTIYWAADNNTTYSNLSASNGGASVSLVTTGEKYLWNTAYGWGNHASAGYAKPEILFNNSSSGWRGDGATISYPETGVVRGTSTTSSYPRIRHTGFQSISLEVGKPYKLSFYAKSNASQTLGIYIGNNTQSVLGMVLGNITTTTSWKKYELFGTALLSSSTADAYGLWLYIATSNISSSGRYTDFKDIKFEPVSEGERLLKRGTSSTSITTVLYPNDYFICNKPMSSLTISELKQPANTSILASYVIQFTPSVSNMTFSYPSTIKWMNGDAPTIFDTTCTYQISIVENLATYQKFK